MRYHEHDCKSTRERVVIVYTNESHSGRESVLCARMKFNEDASRRVASSYLRIEKRLEILVELVSAEVGHEWERGVADQLPNVAELGGHTAHRRLHSLNQERGKIRAAAFTVIY